MSTEMARRLAEACKCSEEAKNLYIETPYQDKEVEQIYLARWRELAEQEAPANASACESSKDAMDFYHKAMEGSKAKAVYGALWVRLANREAPNKARLCKSYEDAERLYQDAPVESEAQVVYLTRMLELKVAALQESRGRFKTLSLVKDDSGVARNLGHKRN